MAASLVTLTEIPTLSRLYALKKLAPAASTSRTPSQSLNDIISTICFDITKLQVDGIVNAANKSLLGGAGVDGAIHKAAGPNLFKECAGLGGCDVGDAKITSAYNLPCQKVIHTVGPIYTSEARVDPKRPEVLLRSCYRRSLEVAVQSNVRSIAFAAISTGVYGYPSGEAAQAAADEVRTFLEVPENAGKLKRVIFCNFEAKDEKAYERVLPQIFPPTERDLSAAH